MRRSARFEPALDALAPALERKVPVAFEASEEREILRALAFAKEFNLDPVIVGGAEAANVIEDLKAAKARVIVGTNFQAPRRRWRARRPRRRRDRHADPHHPRCVRLPRKCRPRSRRPGSRSPSRPADCRTRRTSCATWPGRSRKAGSPKTSALKALTVNAAKLAGAGDRLGTLEKGRMANVIVTEGNLFDTPRIRHVFVAGWPVDIDLPAQNQGGRGGRGGGHS